MGKSDFKLLTENSKPREGFNRPSTDFLVGCTFYIGDKCGKITFLTVKKKRKNDM